MDAAHRVNNNLRVLRGVVTLVNPCDAERSAHLDHVSHVALRPRVVRLVLLAHQDDEVQVVPDVVLQLDVLFKRHCLVVELVPLQS